MATAECKPAPYAEAKRAGEKTYWTGSPCKRGHTAPRYVCDQSCTQCKLEDSETRKARSLTDTGLAERMRKWHRDAKARARKTEAGKRAHYLANKKYTEANRDRVRAYSYGRRRSDPNYRMASWCRSVLHKVLSRQNLRKDAKCVELLGYAGPELRAHIERQFTVGMSWELMGSAIHIDHIVPIAEFVRRGETRPSVIHALTNLRPMWAADNRAKSDKVMSLL